MSRAAFAANKGKTLNCSMSVTSAAPRALQRIADGYVDEKIVLVRKMLMDGASYADIGKELGCPYWQARYYVKQNRLEGFKSQGRERKGQNLDWYLEAMQLRGKHPVKVIARMLGLTPVQVNSLYSRVNQGLIPDPRDAVAMRADEKASAMREKAA